MTRVVGPVPEKGATAMSRYGAKRMTVLAVSTLSSLFIALSAMPAAQAQPPSPGVGRHPGATCYQIQVPVFVPAIGNAHMFGQLCVPRRSTSTSATVQVLIPGATYNHAYFDWPQDPSRYSYVTQ